MSDVREVTEWHEAMEGTLTVAGEDLNDALYDLWITSGIPSSVNRVLRMVGR